MYLFNFSLSLLSSYLHHLKKIYILIAVLIRDKFYLSVLSWPLSRSKPVCPISGRAVSRPRAHWSVIERFERLVLGAGIRYAYRDSHGKSDSGSEAEYKSHVM